MGHPPVLLLEMRWSVAVADRHAAASPVNLAFYAEVVALLPRCDATPEKVEGIIHCPTGVLDSEPPVQRVKSIGCGRSSVDLPDIALRVVGIGVQAVVDQVAGGVILKS